jgi:hypothetical protein
MMDIYHRDYTSMGNGVFRLISGTASGSGGTRTVLNSTVGISAPTNQGQWLLDVTVQYTATASDAGKFIGVAIGNVSGTGNWIEFDNVRLVATSAATGFAGWQAANGTSGAINGDHDNDGVPNGIEWFLGGNTDTTGFTALPGVSNTGGTLSVTWVRHPDYPDFPGNYGTDFVVETSATLTGPWTEESSPGNVTITGNDVTYTFPAPLGAKNFARLKVTGP